MKEQAPSDISKSVMDQIHSGQVRMKPRLYYTLLGVFSLGAIIASGLSVAYLASIVFFWVRIQTADTMAWGARAHLNDALQSFPWWAVALAVMLFSLAVYLARRHGRLYRHKTSTIAAVIMLCSIVVGVGMSYAGIGSIHGSHRPNGQGQQSQHHNGGWRQNN